MSDLNSAATDHVLQEVFNERVRQTELGWTLGHDSGHGRKDWANLISKRCYDLENRPNIPERDILVVIAALAVAGIERLDRGGS